MADNKEALRALKIKTGVLTRVKKELGMYQKEVETETEKLRRMQADGRDAHDIKQQVRAGATSTRALSNSRPTRRGVARAVGAITGRGRERSRRFGSCRDGSRRVRSVHTPSGQRARGGCSLPIAVSALDAVTGDDVAHLPSLRFVDRTKCSASPP